MVITGIVIVVATLSLLLKQFETRLVFIIIRLINVLYWVGSLALVRRPL